MDLFTPDFGLIFWMFVSFAILFFILWKFAWPAILKGVDKRADLIDKGVEYAQNAKQQLDTANEQAQQLLNDARRQHADMLRDADRLKTQMIEDARQAAQEEANKVMESAKVSIQQQQKQAEQALRDQAGELALQIAGKLVKGQMADQKNQSALIDGIIDDIQKENK